LQSDINGRRVLSLTEEGHEWAERIPVDLSAWKLTSAPVVAVSGVESGDDPTREHLRTKLFRGAGLDAVRAEFKSSQAVGLGDMLGLVHAALHALPAKRFVLLAGLSGPGKSLLARDYANAYCAALKLPVAEHHRQIPVRPDWTDPAGLLGFINPIVNPPTFQGTQALALVIKAVNDPENPYFLCLDEMNLARVEHYFAPFLSAMEGARLEIHAEREMIDNVPASVDWPKNLFIIGTVNMDESTHAFSDKVLDRAFVFEFWDVDLDAWAKSKGSSVDPVLLNRVLSVMRPIHAALFEARRHFGYRSLNEVLQFCEHVASSSPSDGVALTRAIDQAVFSKIPTRVRGDDGGGLESALEAVRAVCISQGLSQSLRKVEAMKQSLRSMGAARFWA